MSPRRIGDASCYVLMADSLWHDCGLAYHPQDLDRAWRLRFEDLSKGLFLTKKDGNREPAEDVALLDWLRG